MKLFTFNTYGAKIACFNAQLYQVGGHSLSTILEAMMEICIKQRALFSENEIRQSTKT